MIVDDLAAQERSNALYIAHKPFNVFKYFLIHLLQDVGIFLSVFLTDQAVCMVDMAASIGFTGCYSSLYGKCPGGLQPFLIVVVHVSPPTRFLDKGLVPLNGG